MYLEFGKPRKLLDIINTEASAGYFQQKKDQYWTEDRQYLRLCLVRRNAIVCQHSLKWFFQ